MDVDLRDEHRPRFSLRVFLFAFLAVALLAGLVLPPVTRGLRRRDQELATSSALRKISAALHAYERQHGSFPPLYSLDSDGNPALSWRVLILPFLGEQALFQQFRLDEPWDGPNNAKLITKMPECYREVPSEESDSTYFRAIIGAKTIWSGNSVRTRSDLSNPPIPWLVKSDEPVVWTKPEDIAADELTHKIQQMPQQAITLVGSDNTVVRVNAGIDPWVLDRMLSAGK